MFDPYHRWLAIPPGDRPPTYYQLLGLSPEETDREVIEEAALRQTSHVRTYQTGPYAEACTKLLNEIGQARAVLLNPEKRKEYDDSLIPPPSLPPLPPSVPEIAISKPPAPPRPTPVFDQLDLPAPQPRHSRRAARRSLIGSMLALLGYFVVLGMGGFLAYWLATTPAAGSASQGVDASGIHWRKLLGHETPVNAVVPVSFGGELHALSAGGGFVGDEAIDCAVLIWNLQSGKLVRSIPGHQAPIHALAVSPDGKLLLSAGGALTQRGKTSQPVDCTVRLWDLMNGQSLHVMKGHNGPVRSVLFGPGEHQCVSAGDDGTVRLWNLATATGTVMGNAGSPVEALAMVNNNQLLVGGWNGSLVVWDLKDGAEVNHYPKRSPIYAVAFWLGGKRVISGGGRWNESGSIRIQDRVSGNTIREFVGHTRPVRALALTADGSRLLSGSLDHTVRLWDIASGKQLQQLTDPTSGITSVALSSEGNHLLAGTLDGTVWYWQLP